MATKRKPTPPLRLDEMRDNWRKNKPKEPQSLTCFAVIFLPLKMCKRQNTKFGSQGWQASKDRRETLGYMRMQARPWAEPLSGRPLVRCIRYSSNEPDKYSDWAKVAVDCLCKPNKRSPHRIGIIVDDAPKFAEIDQQWREAKSGKGFCVVEVWGDSSAKPTNVISLSDRIKDRDQKVETELEKRVIERWEGKP